MSLTSIDLGIEEILADPPRRQALFHSITQDEIASQIRELRRRRDLTQIAFARLAEMKQSAVSRLEQAEYAAWNWNTLVRVADTLNARWKIILQPAEEATEEFMHPKEPSDNLIASAPTDAASPLQEDSQFLLYMDAVLRNVFDQNSRWKQLSSPRLQNPIPGSGSVSRRGPTPRIVYGQLQGPGGHL